ncbi:MAG: histidine phosphatase family protein [Microbacteriaceae bacterium]
MRLILLRHGQTPANVGGVIESAHPGPGLTALGLRQARAVPAALDAGSLAPWTPDGIDSLSVSTLLRSRLTAEPLAAATGLAAIERPGLHEVQAGAFEGRADRDAVHGYIGVVARWAAGELGARMPGSEDGTEFFARFDADVAAIEAEGARTAVVVGHGAAIRVWAVVRARDLEPGFLYSHELRNTGFVVLDGSMLDGPMRDGPMRAGWELVDWHADPAGGTALEDAAAADPTGEGTAGGEPAGERAVRG